jgi:hypothetical protein
LEQLLAAHAGSFGVLGQVMVVGRHVWVAPAVRCAGEEVDAEFALFFSAKREAFYTVGWTACARRANVEDAV